MSNVFGRDCSILIKTAYREMVQFGEAELPSRNATHFCGVPYAEETIREAVSLLREEAAIEGDGVCRAIRKSTGVTGCVVTPLTIGTAPLLLHLAMGSGATEGCIGLPVYVSETRNLYRSRLNLLPAEDSCRFDLIQARSDERRLFEGCAVSGFELRINREQAVKLKLDIRGGKSGVGSEGLEVEDAADEGGERFMGDGVTYRINGTEYTNIYGLTILAKKENGTKTELWIKRALEQGSGIPGVIEELTITAQLLRDKYEYRHYGMFRLTLTRLVLVSDETAVDCADAVIGPLRYYCAGAVQAEVFDNK